MEFAGIPAVKQTALVIFLVDDQVAHERSQWTVAGCAVVHQVERIDPDQIAHLGTVIVNPIHDQVCGLEIDELLCKQPHLEQGIQVIRIWAIGLIVAFVGIRIEFVEVDTVNVIVKDVRIIVVIVIQNRRLQGIAFPCRGPCSLEELKPRNEPIGVEFESSL